MSFKWCYWKNWHGWGATPSSSIGLWDRTRRPISCCKSGGGRGRICTHLDGRTHAPRAPDEAACWWAPSLDYSSLWLSPASGSAPRSGGVPNDSTEGAIVQALFARYPEADGTLLGRCQLTGVDATIRQRSERAAPRLVLRRPRSCPSSPARSGSVGHLLAILGGGEPVASRSEVVGDGTVGGEESLSAPQGLVPVESLDIYAFLVHLWSRRFCSFSGPIAMRFSSMPAVVSAVPAILVSLFQPRRSLHLKIQALEHQVAVYQRSVPRPRIQRRTVCSGPGSPAFGQPRTVIAWQQKRFRGRHRGISSGIVTPLTGRRFASAWTRWGSTRWSSRHGAPGKRRTWNASSAVSRHECLAHVIVLSDRRLKRILSRYFDYSHRWRTPLALEMAYPTPRPVRPQALGEVTAVLEVSGLHHHYERQAP
jgi:hypothetical protein